MNIKVDGRRTYFEWLNAGRHLCQGSRGTMSMAREGLIAELFFGFEPQRLVIRLDARGGAIRERLADVSLVRIVFFLPEGFQIDVHRPADRAPNVELLHHDVRVAEAGIEAAADHILELAVPLRSLALTTNDRLQFYVELLQDGASVERVPAEGAIETTVPSSDYELIMWQA